MIAFCSPLLGGLTMIAGAIGAGLYGRAGIYWWGVLGAVVLGLAPWVLLG